jgi:dihydrofolate synthase/folylpolyglutamate synthase
MPLAAVEAGLATVEWPARMEVVARRPLIVLDCAHNVASARALVETLQESFPPAPPARRVLVFAVSNDKNVAGILKELAPHFQHACFARYGNNPRSVPPADLAGLASQESLACSVHATAAEALTAALALATPDDLVCVTGSVFLAGELRPLLVGSGN